MNARSLLLVTLTSTATLAAEPMQVIIFAGGVTEADGAAALASFKKLEATVAKAVTLPAGEPKVVDSGTLPGLKPGFRVVTLGVCKTPAPVLAAIKAIYPGTYSKPLTGDAGPERCPVVSSVSAAAIEPAVKVGASVLNAFTLSESGPDERARPGDHGRRERRPQRRGAYRLGVRAVQRQGDRGEGGLSRDSGLQR